MVKVPQKTIENAYKMTFIVNEFPDHKLEEVISLIQLPAIDINAGLWYAIQQGWLSSPDEKTNMVKVVNLPVTFDFGSAVSDLADNLLFCFQELAKKETDLEEFSLSQWTQGYPSHDLLIATKLLLTRKELAEYQIEDGDSKYTFYTLYENRDKLFGRKQFRNDPLEGQRDEFEPDEPGDSLYN